MSRRLDVVLQKYPEQEEGIRLLASRDPSGNLKYLEWGAKMLAAKQALAPEVADVIALFHLFNGRVAGRRGHGRTSHWVYGDIYRYGPGDLARLRDSLVKLKRSADRRRRDRERLYRIEGEIEADVVYDSEDLVVRHIKNKQASAHYGRSTKWCIAMQREGYFEDYETQNATFFFFERKVPAKDEFDKVCLVMPRAGGDYAAEAFTALDQRVDMIALVRVHGPRVFDIFRDCYDRSERYPASAMAQVYTGDATEEQLVAAFASALKMTKGRRRLRRTYEPTRLLTSICCNDAAPLSLLTEIARRATALHALRRRGTPSFERVVMVAMAIHPNVPVETRESVVKELRRRKVDTDTIRRVMTGGRMGIEYEGLGGGRGYGMHRRRRRSRRDRTVSGLLAIAKSHERRAVWIRKRARALRRRLAAAKKRVEKVSRRALSSKGSRRA